MDMSEIFQETCTELVFITGKTYVDMVCIHYKNIVHESLVVYAVCRTTKHTC